MYWFVLKREKGLWLRAERKKPVERGKLQELECEAEREGLLTSGKKNLIAKGMGLRHYLLRQIRNDLGMHQSEFESLRFSVVVVNLGFHLTSLSCSLLCDKMNNSTDFAESL